MGEFTYEHLFDVLRRERSREELQELDTDFYARAQSFIERSAEQARSMDVLSAEGDHLRTQLANAKKLLKELYDRREKKIMLLALNKARTGSHIIDTASLAGKERELFESVVQLLIGFRGALAPLTNGDVASRPAERPVSKPAPKPKQAAPEPKKPVEEPSEGLVVRIKGAVPRFMGSDQETFGPFDKGVEVTLPDRIARILVKKGRAEIVTE